MNRFIRVKHKYWGEFTWQTICPKWLPSYLIKTGWKILEIKGKFN